MYVLDEPSIGLHQRDNDRLLATLKHLRDLGNTVIVVEHDEDAIRAADYVVDMGPGRGRARRAGRRAGHAARTSGARRIRSPASTSPGSGRSRSRAPRHRADAGARARRSRGARGNNLKNVDAAICRSGLFVCVTGVSGSGKSTLINDTLYHAVARHLYGSAAEPAPHDEIEGLEHFDKVISVDQSPIGRTPRSQSRRPTPACSRRSASSSRRCQEARERGYGPGRFSFNVKGGRCEACQGDGLIKVEMHFLPDVYVPCDVCHGQRYNRETLEIRYKGKNIHEVLEMTVEQALAFFERGAGDRAQARDAARRRPRLHHARPVGDHAVGRRGAAREARARALEARHRPHALHPRRADDRACTSTTSSCCSRVLHRLRDHGNTVVVIEHNLDVIKTADWIIDLGPEGGDGGGHDHRGGHAGAGGRRRRRATPAATCAASSGSVRRRARSPRCRTEHATAVIARRSRSVLQEPQPRDRGHRFDQSEEEAMKPVTKQRTHVLYSTLAALALAAGGAVAQTYPDKPVKIISPFSAGGPADFYARYMGQRLEKPLGQPFVIENRLGGGGVIGTDAAAKSPPDGYTLLVMSNTQTVNESLRQKKPYKLMTRPRPDRAAQLLRPAAGRAPVGAGEESAGADRARQGEPGQAQLRLLRPGHALPHGGRALQVDGGTRHRARAAQGELGRAHRRDGRPGGDDVRRDHDDDEHAEAGKVRALAHERPDALGGHARRADGVGGRRPRLRRGDLARASWRPPARRSRSSTG